MNRFKETLTPEALVDEYVGWTLLHKNGRSWNDLRFGQCLCNFYMKEGQNFLELFYVEGAKEAFDMAHEEITHV